MTTKKKTEKKETKPKSKRILIELVQESQIEEHKIMGALGKAGLIDQYEMEQSKYPRFKIEPTLTQDEFDKILKDFL